MNQEESLRVIAVHHGEQVPAFDVRVSIAPSGKCDETLERTWHPGDPRQSYFAAITPHWPQMMQLRLTPACSETYYQAYVDTRNRLTYQQILVTKEGAELAWRLRVVDVKTRASLFFDPAGGEGSAVAGNSKAERANC